MKYLQIDRKRYRCNSLTESFHWVGHVRFIRQWKVVILLPEIKGSSQPLICCCLHLGAFNYIAQIKHQKYLITQRNS